MKPETEATRAQIAAMSKRIRVLETTLRNLLGQYASAMRAAYGRDVRRDGNPYVKATLALLASQPGAWLDKQEEVARERREALDRARAEDAALLPSPSQPEPETYWDLVYRLEGESWSEPEPETCGVRGPFGLPCTFPASEVHPAYHADLHFRTWPSRPVSEDEGRGPGGEK